MLALSSGTHSPAWVALPGHAEGIELIPADVAPSPTGQVLWVVQGDFGPLAQQCCVSVHAAAGRACTGTWCVDIWAGEFMEVTASRQAIAIGTNNYTWVFQLDSPAALGQLLYKTVVLMCCASFSHDSCFLLGGSSDVLEVRHARTGQVQTLMHHPDRPGAEFYHASWGLNPSQLLVTCSLTHAGGGLLLSVLQY